MIRGNWYSGGGGGRGGGGRGGVGGGGGGERQRDRQKRGAAFSQKGQRVLSEGTQEKAPRAPENHPRGGGNQICEHLLCGGNQVSQMPDAWVAGEGGDRGRRKALGEDKAGGGDSWPDTTILEEPRAGVREAAGESRGAVFSKASQKRSIRNGKRRFRGTAERREGGGQNRRQQF